MSNLEMLELGLQTLVQREAEAEAALERARTARIKQEGALEWERARTQMEEAKAQELAEAAAREEAEAKG